MADGDSASSFTIAEQSGAKRTVTLAGRALPYRPFTLTGSMRAETTWYPGSPIASMQVLGASEDETVISGIWKDRFLKENDADGKSVVPDAVATVATNGGRGEQVEDALDLCKTIDSIRRQGQLVEVTWDEQVRLGLIRKFKQAWQRREIVEWELTFEWISQGEKQNTVAFNPGVGQKNLFNKMVGAFNDMMDAVDTGLNVAQDFKDGIQDKIGKVNHAINRVSNTVNNVVNGVMDTMSSAVSTLSALKSIATSCQDIVDDCQDRVARTVLNVRSIVDITMGEALAAEEYLRGIEGPAKVLRDLAVDQGEQLLARIDQQELVAVFTARADADLRDVAAQFYGSPEEWKRLLTYNGFSSSGLAAGDVVLVPRLLASGG